MANESFTSSWPSFSPGRVLEIPIVDQDIAAARHAVAAHLGRWGCTNVDDAVLVLSELVTNAVIHTGRADRAVVGCDDHWIGISVHDTDPAVIRPPAEAPSIGGRGLPIVERLSCRWGSTPLGDGKNVWAVLRSSAAR